MTSASRSCSVRPRWRSPNSCRANSPRPASRTRSSTRSSTSARPRSWRRPDASTPSRWRPTWPVEAWTSCSAATTKASPARGAEPRLRARVRGVRRGVPSGAGELQARLRRRGRSSPRARWSLRARHRATRLATNRQPAARTLGTSRRPRREPLLPVARRRTTATLRDRCRVVGHGPHDARRPPDRGEDGLQGHRTRAEHRRGSQRRDSQGRAQVRRGDERTAQGHLRPAPAGHRRRGHARRDDRHDRRDPHLRRRRTARR